MMYRSSSATICAGVRFSIDRQFDSRHRRRPWAVLAVADVARGCAFSHRRLTPLRSPLLAASIVDSRIALSSLRRFSDRRRHRVDRELVVGEDAEFGRDPHRRLRRSPGQSSSVCATSALAAAVAYGAPEPMAAMPSSGSITSPSPESTSSDSASATMSCASSRRR